MKKPTVGDKVKIVNAQFKGCSTDSIGDEGIIVKEVTDREDPRHYLAVKVDKYAEPIFCNPRELKILNLSKTGGE